METGDDSGATGREVTDPPIGVVDAVTMHRMTRRRTAMKSRFTWSHHGTTPNSGSMYIVNEWNQKDEILIWQNNNGKPVMDTSWQHGVLY